ncbi:Ribonuclease H-like domain,Domain of unknown function DUF4371 [Cinara cedri]|uniref:DUF4371 domain-containing protein n=1 Tax=Cinara cedri TaxID=506608 RepID=A0A5E4M4G7_9HEMI|nr:Ribonuclease H-like domain,Domain of unknown function DUF4371 [Cinara cedri]
MAKVHDKCDTHKLALAKYKGWCNSKIQGSVTTMIDSQIRIEVARNRTMLESLVRCAIYCARQDIGLRGHSETTEISEVVNNDIATENKGNFLALVKLLCILSQTFCSAYEAIPKNAKYTSKIIQNDMISAASTVIAQSILKEVQEGSKIFSLIVDEARNDAKLEQMSICTRYVHNSVVKEKFLGFVKLRELNANSLSCNIKLFLNNFGLDLSNCLNMSGNLCPYIHCHAHKWNLVLVDVSRKIEEVHDTIGLLEAVYAFQSSSTPYQLDKVSKFKSIHYFKNNFTLVLTELKECNESSKSKEASEAKVNILSLNLQTTTLDYSHCAKLMKSTKEQLINLRSDKIFINIYNEAVKVLKNQCLIGKSLFLDNLTLADLHQQISNCGETFDHVKKIIELVMVIPVSSASAERSFYTMHCDKLLKDPTAVLEVFASMQNRRIQFQI